MQNGCAVGMGAGGSSVVPLLWNTALMECMLQAAWGPTRVPFQVSVIPQYPLLSADRVQNLNLQDREQAHRKILTQAVT